MKAHRLGTWTLPSGDSADVDLIEVSEGLAELRFFWDSGPPFVPGDEVLQAARAAGCSEARRGIQRDARRRALGDAVSALDLMPALDQTLLALRAHPWQYVVLGVRSKKPAGEHWAVTTDPLRLTNWVADGGNLGLVCHESTGVAVLDPDRADAWDDMADALGPPGKAWVQTGSGKRHYYVAWESDLPAKLIWNGVTLGEIQRGPGQQQVVIPPSTHPDTCRRYEWLVDPATEPLEPLPQLWRSYLIGSGPRPLTGQGDIIAAALRQPGAKRRASGLIKFQCAGCLEEGHDHHHDNGAVFPDGRWGCAVGSLAHRAAIGRQLGAVRNGMTGAAIMPDVHYLEAIAHFIAEDDPPLTYIIPELVPAGVMTLIHGAPRSRKSLTAFELALAAATGTAAFGLARFTPPGKFGVLWIQEEDPRSLTRPRVRRLVAARCGDTPPDTLHVSVRRGVDLDDALWVAKIIEDAKRLGAKLIVFDAARRLSALTDEGPAKVRQLTAVFRSIVTQAGVAVIVVHHDVKDPQTGQDLRRRGQRASGGDWFAASECPIHVERVGDGETLIYPQDYKFSLDPAPFTFACEYDGGLITRLVGRDTTTAHAETASVRGTLLAWLKAHPMASKTAMKAAGFGWETISASLDSLQRDGLVDEAPGRKKGSKLYFAITSEASPTLQDGSPETQPF